MFKHWMSKAQNNTSHFDKGAAFKMKTIIVRSIISRDKDWTHNDHHLLSSAVWLLRCWVDANFLSVFRVYFKSSVLLLHYLHWRQEVKRGMHRFKLRRDILNRLRARAISYLLSCTHKIYRQVLNYGRSIRITFLVVSFFLQGIS